MAWVDPLGLNCEKAAKAWIKSFEEEYGDRGIHGLRRHGAGITLAQQKHRAVTGYTPDGFPGRAVDSTRFISYSDHKMAIKKALESYNPLIHKNGKVDIDMGKVIAEGYTSGGEEYFKTSIVRASFNIKTGKMYSIFGIAE